MKRYERIGVRRESIDIAYRERAIAQDLEACSGTTTVNMTAFGYSSLPVSRGLLALEHYLLDDRAAAVAPAEQVCRDTHEFFFGKWREGETEAGKQDHAFWVAEGSGWGDAFRTALCWGAATGQWDQLARLASYPSEACHDGDDVGGGWKELYIALAAYLRGGDAKEVGARAGTVKGKGSPALLAEVLLALVARDSDVFGTRLGKYLKRYRKSDFPMKSMLEKQSLVGSFLVLAAERDGLKVVLPADDALYVVHRL